MSDLRTFGPHRSWLELRAALAARLPSGTLSDLDKAVAYATACHQDQRRPTGAPYVEHLLEALDVLVNGPGVTDPVPLAAAVLHDVVEDTEATIDDVRLRFGGDVAEIVRWVTKPEPSPDETADRSRRRYLESLSSAPDQAIVVKLADRLSNVQRLNAHPRLAKRQSYYRETVQYLVPLAARHPWFRDWYVEWAEQYSFLGRTAD